MLGENLGIDEFIEGWDRVRLGIVLENMIGIFELEVIGERQKISALMEERPEVCAIGPTNILKDALIDFKGRFLQIQGEVLME